ncbi:MAG TPA: AIR synthase related protein [Solirubrobacter sp.]|nr:AIR synthase related protein [Solirubrobacter sp.]
MLDLDALVAAVRSAPGLLGKRDLQLVRRLEVDGDDAALVPHKDGFIVTCGEAMSPPFLKADPFAAGAAAVVTNVSDVRAMGGRPLAIVDMLISPDKEHAETVLDGIAFASEKLGVPVVGGHLTLGHEPALSASCTGFATRPLRAANAKPGDALVAAFATEGRWMSDTQPFWTSLYDRDVKADGEALVEIAEQGLAHAARDVSMPGIAGSLLQMIEGAGCGANLHLEAIPKPHGAPLERWLLTFPSFGFLLATTQPDETCAAFTNRGLQAAQCGTFDDTHTLKLNGRIAWDLREQPLTGLSPSAGA